MIPSFLTNVALLQVHPGNMVAQAAGHRDRDDFNPRLGPNPEAMPRFQGMVGSILPSIDRQIRQMREVQQLLVIAPDQLACIGQTHHDHICSSCFAYAYVVTYHMCCMMSIQEASKPYPASRLCICDQYAAETSDSMC